MGLDGCDWDEDGYRNSILKEREIQARTVFRAIFPPAQNPNPDAIVAASSDGTLASYSISSCFSQVPSGFGNSGSEKTLLGLPVADPISSFRGMTGLRTTQNFMGTPCRSGTGLDCRNGNCILVIDAEKDKKLKEIFSSVSCIALDVSESWLAYGRGQSFSVWNIPAREHVTRVSTHASLQGIVFDDNQILAVGAEPLLTRFDMNGLVLSQIQCAPPSAFSVSLHQSGITAVAGYGGVVKVIWQFGSHLCSFPCR